MHILLNILFIYTNIYNKLILNSPTNKLIIIKPQAVHLTEPPDETCREIPLCHHDSKLLLHGLPPTLHHCVSILSTLTVSRG